MADQKNETTTAPTRNTFSAKAAPEPAFLGAIVHYDMPHQRGVRAAIVIGTAGDTADLAVFAPRGGSEFAPGVLHGEGPDTWHWPTEG